jgi:hypothetical protein
MNGSSISIVVQGPVHKVATFGCLKSIKSSLPDSRIILSTSIGTDISYLESLYDEVVFSEDPGPNMQSRWVNGAKDKIKFSNLNRQIKTSVNGLLRVETKYVLKFRTDLALCNPGFLNYFDSYQEFDDKFKCVEKRVLLWNLYTRNPKIKFPLAYHFSDVVMFGLRDDLLNIWDIPLSAPDDIVKYGKHEFARYAPEQHVWLNFLRKYHAIECPEFDTKCEDVIRESENYMLNNVVLLNTKQFGLKVLKKDILSHHAWTCYTHRDWLALYKKSIFKESTLGYIWLCIKNNYKLIFFVPLAINYVWRKVVKAVTCLIPNKKLRRQVRRLYWRT